MGNRVQIVPAVVEVISVYGFPAEFVVMRGDKELSRHDDREEADAACAKANQVRVKASKPKLEKRKCKMENENNKVDALAWLKSAYDRCDADGFVTLYRRGDHKTLALCIAALEEEREQHRREVEMLREELRSLQGEG